MGTVVVGCGLMGSALARGLAKAGNPVVVWNRTPERAENLVGPGIRAERDIVKAVDGSRLIVVCSSTYETSRSSLEPVGSFGGATVVNLTTASSPDRADEFQRWVVDRGGRYLDGAIIAYPENIGDPDTKILFAGDGDAWTEHEAVLMSLGGGSRHISESVKAPNVLDLAIVGSFYISSLAAYVEASAYAQDQGVSAKELAVLRDYVLEFLGQHMKLFDQAIETDSYETDQSTLGTYAVAAEGFLEAMQNAGHRARLLAAALESMQAAQAAGLGDLGFEAQAKVVKSPAKLR